MNMYHGGSNSFVSEVQKLYINGEYITDLVTPEGIEEIPYCCFTEWTQLKSVTIPEGTKTISTGAFYSCSSLETIYIPHSVTEIKSTAFYCCTSLKTIYYEGTINEWHHIKLDKNFDLNVSNYTIVCTDGEITVNK
jgi:hypothetical protein